MNYLILEKTILCIEEFYYLINNKIKMFSIDSNNIYNYILHKKISYPNLLIIFNNIYNSYLMGEIIEINKALITDIISLINNIYNYIKGRFKNFYLNLILNSYRKIYIYPDYNNSGKTRININL